MREGEIEKREERKGEKARGEGGTTEEKTQGCTQRQGHAKLCHTALGSLVNLLFFPAA